MFILLAEGLTEGEASPEEDEKITSRAFTRKELEQMIHKESYATAKPSLGFVLLSVSFLRHFIT